MQIRVLTADDVRTALPMDKAIEAVRLAFGQFSSKNATVPLRTRVHTQKGVTLLMPAHLHRSGDFAVKIVSVYENNPKLGLPTVTATVIVLDHLTGMPLAFMDGDSLTALRTGAAGGLAADLLARKNAETATLFGAGVQARSQLSAAMTVRNIKRVNLVDPVSAAVEKLAKEIESHPLSPEINIIQDPEEAVRDADIIMAATTTQTPLFDGKHLKSGAHVTGVGSYTPEMQEIDTNTVNRSKVVVDSRESCLAEAGDITLSSAEIYAEIGEIVNGDIPGRQSEEEITFFKSVGLAAQDAAAAAMVVREAEKKDLGNLIGMS